MALFRVTVANSLSLRWNNWHINFDLKHEFEFVTNVIHEIFNKSTWMHFFFFRLPTFKMRFIELWVAVTFLSSRMYTLISNVTLIWIMFNLLTLLWLDSKQYFRNWDQKQTKNYSRSGSPFFFFGFFRQQTFKH